jgi:hypothetical protein
MIKVFMNTQKKSDSQARTVPVIAAGTRGYVSHRGSTCVFLANYASTPVEKFWDMEDLEVLLINPRSSDEPILQPDFAISE